MYSAIYGFIKSYLTHVRDQTIRYGYITWETRVVIYALIDRNCTAEPDEVLKTVAWENVENKTKNFYFSETPDSRAPKFYIITYGESNFFRTNRGERVWTVLQSLMTTKEN